MVTQARVAPPGLFGSGSSGQRIWLDNVQCTGTELYLRNCQSDGWGVHHCAHWDDIGVICEGECVCVGGGVCGGVWVCVYVCVCCGCVVCVGVLWVCCVCGCVVCVWHVLCVWVWGWGCVDVGVGVLCVWVCLKKSPPLVR